MATKKKVSTTKAVKAANPKKVVKKTSPKKQKDLKAGSRYE